MSVVAPPEPPRPHELEALIREARSRQRRRWIGAATLVTLLAGAALGAHSIANGGSSTVSQPDRRVAPVKVMQKCGIKVAGPRILGSDGATVYREPIRIRQETNPDSIPSQVQCSGQTVWIVWFNGVAASQEGNVGARSLDRGRTWKLVSAEEFFGVNAPHQLDSYLGPWTLHGPRDAYLTGTCPACGSGTVSLWVTKDAGRTFRSYHVLGSDAWVPRSIRIHGRRVAIRERRDLGLRLRWRTVIVDTA